MVDSSVKDIDEPVVIQFNKPSSFTAVDSMVNFTYILRTAKGNITVKPVSLFWNSGGNDQPVSGNSFRFTAPGVYTVTARYANKRIAGVHTVVVFPKITKGSTFLVDTVTRVSSVEIKHYPWFFTTPGVSSDTISAEVIRTRLERQLNGRYKLYYGITEERPDRIRVSAPQVVIPENGALLSVNPGRSVFSVIKENVESLPKMSTVSMDFRGIWNISSATDGRTGQLYVSRYPARAVHSAYEQNSFAESDPYFLQFVPQPQEVTSTIYNSLNHYDVCNAGGAIGFADYCVFACLDSGKFTPGEIIGGMRACDGENGRLTYINNQSMNLRTDNGQNRIYSRTDISDKIVGRWNLKKYYESDPEDGPYTEYPTGEYFDFAKGGTFTGVKDGGSGSGTWKVLDDNITLFMDSPDNFSGPFTVKNLTETTMQLYISDQYGTIVMDFTKG